MEPQVHWLVEDGPFEEDLDPIVAEIQRQGFPVKHVKYSPFQSGEYRDLFDEEACVIVYASINLCSQLIRQTPWVPGPFLKMENYDILHLKAHFGRYMLNYNGGFHCWEDARNLIGGSLDTESFFVRPNQGSKLFAGMQIRSFSDIKYIDSKCKPHDLVFVASAKRMHDEYRLMVVDGKIISGSKYKENGQFHVTLDSYVPEIVLEKSQEILDEVDWTPERCFVLDVDFDPESLGVKVIEINAISSSGWYAADPEPIIRELSRIAVEDWKDINEI